MFLFYKIWLFIYEKWGEPTFRGGSRPSWTCYCLLLYRYLSIFIFVVSLCCCYFVGTMNCIILICVCFTYIMYQLIKIPTHIFTSSRNKSLSNHPRALLNNTWFFTRFVIQDCAAIRSVEYFVTRLFFF